MNRAPAAQDPESARRRLRALAARHGSTPGQDREPPRAVPLSGSQRSMWLHDRLTPESATYVETVAFDLSGPLDSAALRSALHTVVRDQDALRTVFVTGDSGPVQVVRTGADAGPGLTEVTCGAGVHTRDDVIALADADGLFAPFDLGNGPLARARLHRLSPTRAVFVLAVHHLIWDGASTGILLHALFTAYETALGGATPAPQPPAVTYPEYVRAERGRWAGTRFRDSVDHWANRLATAAPPGDPAPGMASRPGAVLERPVPATVVDTLRSTAPRLGCTPFMLLVAALSAALRPASLPADTVLAAPMSVRTPGTERLIGNLVHTLPIPLELPAGASRRTYVEQVRTACAEAWEHRAVPLEQVVASVPQHRAAHDRYTRTILDHVRLPDPLHGRAGLSWTPHWLPGRTAKCELLIAWIETADTTIMRVEYPTATRSPESAGLLADRVLDTLQALLDDLDAPLATLPTTEPAPAPAGPSADPAPGPSAEVPPAVRAAAHQAWQEVLGVDDLDDEDDFFALGGRSMDAARIAAKTGAALDLVLRTRTVLEADCFGDFVARVGRIHEKNSD
ncbi:condensation domain-containing protein [Streptomyces sp. NPDC050161]|uniref:condensation domain-containing protein n=1 Tax=Streptomyces sp. NPDC050161 TaxID=3365604 RepID=UPI0037A39910